MVSGRKAVLKGKAMGCNYYHRTNICPTCGRFDEWHIGKNSMGWQFGFRGYKPEEWEEDTPVITSWVEWQKVLSKGEIYDEYGERISFDDFKEIVESKHRDTALRNARGHSKTEWLDGEGYDFYGEEFS